MNFKPLKDRILVKYSDEPEKSAGGLYIPDTAKEKPQKGEVISVGSGKITDDGKLQKMEIKVGDKVLFEKYCFAISKPELRVYFLLATTKHLFYN